MPGIPKPKKHWKKQNNIWRLLARPSHSPKPLEHCVFLFLVFSRKSKKTKKTHNIWRLLAGPSHPAKTSGKMCVFLFSRGKKQPKNIWRLLAGPSHPAKTSGKMLFFFFSRVFFVFQMSGPQNLHGASQGSAGGLHFLRLGVSRDMHCIYCVYIDHLVF